LLWVVFQLSPYIGAMLLTYGQTLYTCTNSDMGILL